MWYVYTRGAQWILAFYRASFAVCGVGAMDYGESPLETGRFESCRRFVVTQETLQTYPIWFKEITRARNFYD